LLQAVQKFALSGWGLNWRHADSPERWICVRRAGLVTGMI